MKKIILLLCGGGDVSRALDIALQEAKQQAETEIIPLFVIDDQVPASVSSWLIYVGFMGDKPSDDYKHTILQEYRRRAQEDLEEIAEKISAAGVSCHIRLLEGPLLETIKQACAEEKADLLVLALPSKNEVGSSLVRDTAKRLQKEGLYRLKLVE